MKTVIEIAREAGWPDSLIAPVIMAKLAEFAELVRADERARMAEQPAQQEPVAHFGSAYVNENGVHITTVLGPVAIPQDAKLYTSPPAQRTWVGLTPDELNAIFDSMKTWSSFQITDVYFAIEAKLKEKNT